MQRRRNGFFDDGFEVIDRYRGVNFGVQIGFHVERVGIARVSQLAEQNGSPTEMLVDLGVGQGRSKSEYSESTLIYSEKDRASVALTLDGANPTEEVFMLTTSPAERATGVVNSV